MLITGVFCTGNRRYPEIDASKSFALILSTRLSYPLLLANFRVGVIVSSQCNCSQKTATVNGLPKAPAIHPTAVGSYKILVLITPLWYTGTLAAAVSSARRPPCCPVQRPRFSIPSVQRYPAYRVLFGARYNVLRPVLKASYALCSILRPTGHYLYIGRWLLIC